MRKAHRKSKKRPRSPPSRWELEPSNGDDAVAAVVLERRTKNKLDIRSPWKGKGKGQDVRPPCAKEKATLRMKELEMERDFWSVSSPHIRSVTFVSWKLVVMCCAVTHIL